MTIKHDVLESLKTCYKTTPIPTIITDDQLNIIWSNDHVINFYPSIKLPIGIKKHLSEQQIESIIADLKNQKSITLDFNFNPMFFGSVMTISPLIADDILTGSVINIIKDKKSSFSNPGGAERVISTCGHITRNSLSKIFASLSLLARVSGGNKDVTKYTDAINAQCFNLLRFSTHISEFSRIISGSVSFEFTNGNLSELVRNIADSCNILCSETGIKLTYSVPEEDIITVFDNQKLSVAILNMLLNSYKYTRPENEIKLSLVKYNTQATITVTDKGCGIKEEDLIHVFQPFYSTDDRDKMDSGVGLGLYIVKNVVLGHGGTIVINSIEGKGTTITFSIPIKSDSSLPMLKAKESNYLTDKFSPLYIEFAEIACH